MLQVIDSLERFKHYRMSLGEHSLGFVPTMGALHEGHASLLRRSVDENNTTVLSVFVNPTQFDQSNDLNQYPRTFAADRQLAEDLGVDVLLYPQAEEIYPDQYTYKVTESALSRRLCGAHRRGHFDGVLTVVMKLLNLTRPRRAYFGEKDFQQLALVRGMVAAFFMDVEIVGCPTVRETDGLAASSRNGNLNAEDRRRASSFPELLRSPIPVDQIARTLAEQGFGIDYIEEIEDRRFGAVHLGQVRLIDNVPLPSATSEER